MPITTSNLKLNEDQEAKLVDFILRTKTTLEGDNSARIERDRRSWEIYENQMDHRMGEAGIFAYANDQLPLILMLVDQFTARAEDEIFGSDPFVRWGAEGAADYDLSQKVNRFLQWKFLRKGSLKSDLVETILPQFIQRAVVLKSIYEKQETGWEEDNVELLFDKTINGFVEVPDFGFVVRDVAEWETSADPVTGQEYLYLGADPSVVWDEARYSWKMSEKPVQMKRTLFKGARSAMVAFDKFLCPSDAPSIDAASSTLEFYAKPLSWVKDVWLERPWAPWKFYAESRASYYVPPAASKVISSPLHGQSDEESKPNLPQYEDDPPIEIVEAWVRYDILGRGTPQDIVVWLDVKEEKIINYEYWAKVTPDMKRPYSAIALMRRPGRWYGKSLVERLEPYQTYVDKQWNAESYRNEMVANPVTVINPEAVREQVTGDIGFHPGKKYTSKNGATASDFMSFAAVPDLDTKTQKLIEFLSFRIQMWLGTTNLAQGEYADVPLNNTATGVEASQQEKSKVSKRWIRRTSAGFIEHLKKLSKLELATMDEREVYEYTEGSAPELGEITPEDVANLEVDVNITLAQSQNTREVQKSQLALDVQQRYFTTPPEMRPFVKPLLKRILNAQGFPDSDNLLPDNAPYLPPEVAGGGSTPGGAPPMDESGVPPVA